MTTPTRDNELEALILKHIYHRDTESFDEWPAFSVSIEMAWGLMQYINRPDSGISWLAFRDALRKRGLALGLPQDVAARSICEAALEAAGVKR